MHSSRSRSSPARRALAPRLVEELVRQNRALTPSVARDAHLAALGRSDVGVCVTGQQVGLFLGPAYSFYKAATTVALARRIAAEEGRPTVPVFWLQSEDHDAEEVAVANVLDDDDAVAAVELAATPSGRVSMANVALGQGVEPALAKLRGLLDSTPFGGETLALLERHYRADTGWVASFAGVLGEVFADEGLLVLDPRTTAIAELARPIHHQALSMHAQIDEAVEQGAALVVAAGDTVMVTPRPQCSLSFFHADGAGGPRHRLVRDADGWSLPSSVRRFQDDELLALLEAEPLRFSTSALLRVVLQASLLPTVAHVVGPGEARYLQQMGPLFEAYELTPPPVVPRARMLVTDVACRRRLGALGITLADLTPERELLLALAADDPGLSGEDVSARLLRTFDEELSRIAPDVESVDATLTKALSKNRRHVARGVTKLGQQIDRARSRRDAVRVDRVATLCRRLLPNDAPQERVLSFPHFAARFGVAPWARAVREACDDHLEALEQGMPSRVHEVAL